MLQAYSNGYFLYFTAVPVACVAVHGLWRSRPSLTALLVPLMTSAAAILAALAPVAAAYLRVRREQGLTRLPGDLLQYSAPLEAYARVADRAWAWRHRCRSGVTSWSCFPGC